MSRRGLFVLLIPLIAVGVLLAVTYADGALGSADSAFWRQSLLGPIVITYVVAISPYFERFRLDAIESLRRLAADVETFDATVDAARPDRRARLIGAGTGAIVSIALLQPWREVEGMVFTTIYRVVATIVMGALIGIIVQQSILGANLFTKLHTLPMRVNVFSAGDLEPVAQRSLFMSLFLLGGISIGVLLIPNQDLLGMTLTVTLTLVAAGVFFLGMRNTHVLMSDAKDRELAIVRANMQRVYEDMNRRFRDDDLGESLAQLNTLSSIWSNYEKRLKEAPEWPLTNSMLRRLVLSTLIPVVLLSTQRIAIESVLNVFKLGG